MRGQSWKPIDTPGTELPAGTLIQGTPYAVIYSNSDSVFYLRGFFGNPYNVPIGGILDFIGPGVPNSSFVLPYGQAISRTTYSALFSLVGTTYGTGDGSTTFNIPDLRGRVTAGKDDMGGSSAFRLTSAYLGAAGDQLGSGGGSQSHTLTTTEMPNHNHTLTDPGHTHGTTPPQFRALGVTNAGSFSFTSGATAANDLSINSSTTGISIASAGGGAAHAIVQPTIIVNKLLRII